MNKKAQIAEALILLVLIAVGGYGLFRVYEFQGHYASQISVPTIISAAYETQDKSEIFAKEAAKLSVQEAAYNSTISISCPKNADGIMAWEKCISQNKINDQFVKETDSELRNLLNSDIKYKITLGENINFEFENQMVNLSGSGYNGTYVHSTKFTIENPLKESLETIYQKTVSRKVICNNEKPFDSCMNQLAFNDWKIMCASNSGQQTICSLESKKNYFHDNSFSKIDLKFALSN